MLTAATLLDGRKLTTTVDLAQLLAGMSDEAKAEIVDLLACDEAIVRAVADQILTGWTEAGSHGARSYGRDPEPRTALDVARRRVAEGASEVAEAEIASLKRQIAASNKRNDELHREIERLRLAVRALGGRAC